VRVGSLCSGIGGFDLAARWLGWSTLWHAEIAPYPSAVFAQHFPDSRALGDLTTIDWGQVERPDVLCAGFPCQPASAAGKRRGTDDERWLWPEIARAVRDLRPRYLVLENVPGLLSVNRGGAMGEVLGDLARCDYDAEGVLLSAADVGAPHLRLRWWCLATPAPFPHALERRVWELRQWLGEQHRESGAAEPRDDGEARALGHPDLFADGGLDAGWEDGDAAGELAGAGEALANAEGQPERAGLCEERESQERGRRSRNGRQPLPDASGPGLSLAEHEAVQRTGRGHERGAAPERDWWAVEPDVGRVAHGVPARVDRLTALGNAIVPEAAYRILATIADAEAVT
jgi:DNA (cytosine-5)-methyltransferase 1